MQTLDRLLNRVADRPVSVLIEGETGTGKELVARALHSRSPRRDGPLRVVNCAAIPETLVESAFFGHVKGAFTGADRDQPGIFEQARGGTVFLDEVGELSSHAQAALLRVLENREVWRLGSSRVVEVDARILAATHRDLLERAEREMFRLDLYHRLVGVMLRVPPLRARTEDVEPLAEHFLRRTAIQWKMPALRLAPNALDALRQYSWPGNVRELRNTLERAVALAESDMITLEDLPAHFRQGRASSHENEARTLPPQTGLGLRASVRSLEFQLIQNALDASDGNRRAAAVRLHLPLRTLERKLRNLRRDP